MKEARFIVKFKRNTFSIFTKDKEAKRIKNKINSNEKLIKFIVSSQNTMTIKDGLFIYDVDISTEDENIKEISI
jgi:hypothetical protein